MNNSDSDNDKEAEEDEEFQMRALQNLDNIFKKKKAGKNTGFLPGINVTPKAKNSKLGSWLQKNVLGNEAFEEYKEKVEKEKEEEKKYYFKKPPSAET